MLFCAGWTLAAALTATAHQPFLEPLFMPEYAPFFIGGMGLYLLHRDRRGRHGLGHRRRQLGSIGQHWAVAGLWHKPNPAGPSPTGTPR